MDSSAFDINCPVCGAAVPARLRHSKLVVCDYCQTSLFLEDEAVKHAGVKSVLTQEPSILSLGKRFKYRNWSFEPIGKIRFDYGDGFWEEWWVALDSGANKWISIDEGDIAVEAPLEVKGHAPAFDALQVGQTIGIAGQKLTVTEKNRATCVGMAGELPEVIFPGDFHDYVHFSGPRGLLVTGEYFEGKVEFFRGVWVDPFDVIPG